MIHKLLVAALFCLPTGMADRVKHALQFRMEMFNAPNHVQLGSPNANWGNQNAAPAGPASSFGQIRGTVTTMRQIQFALKYNF